MKIGVSRGTLRVRLTVLTSGVFLVVGAALLTATYFVVAATLPRATPVQNLQRQELLVCKAQQSAAAHAPATVNGKPVPHPRAPDQFCRTVFQQAAQVGVTSERSSTLQSLMLYFVFGLGAMSVVAAGASWFLAGRALRPLRDITDAASRASRATLSQRLDLPGGDGELKKLGDTFDEMLDRLDAAFAAQERFVADASHELRTPLAALRAVVDVTLAKDDPTPDQVQRMGRDIRTLLEQAETLIAALLMLSRSDAGVTAAEPIDLAKVVDDALTGSAAAGLTVKRDLSTTPVCADRLLVERAVANLVDNAVTHNDDRRWMRAATFSSDTEAGVTIESTGAVISPTDAAQLFRPFYRAAARTGNGHGLGLAIVRSVALAHGGRCEAAPRPDGGLAVTIAVPVAPDQP